MSNIYDQSTPYMNILGECRHCHSDPELFDVNQNQNQNEIKKFIEKLQECNVFYKEMANDGYANPIFNASLLTELTLAFNISSIVETPDTKQPISSNLLNVLIFMYPHANIPPLYLFFINNNGRFRGMLNLSKCNKSSVISYKIHFI